MREIGVKAARRVMVSSITQMVLRTKEVGLAMKNMDLAMKNGQMAPLMRANTLKVSRKAKAPSDGQMAQCT